MYSKLSKKQQKINMGKAYMKAVYNYIDILGFNYLKSSDYVLKSRLIKVVKINDNNN